MSSVSEQAKIDVMIADYASMDSTGCKANLLGIGGNVLPLTPLGLTTRFSVVTQIHVPAEVCPVETALEISLRDGEGQLFSIPGPTPQIVRYATVLTLAVSPAAVGLDQSNHIGVININVLDFGNGMPLPPNNYSWHVTLDGDEERAVNFNFCVPKPSPSLVIG